MMFWALLFGAGGLALAYQQSRNSARRPLTLDEAIAASFRRMVFSIQGLENARGVYKIEPIACVVNNECRICYWQHDLGGNGVWETIDVRVRGCADRMVLKFKDSRLVSWTQDGTRREQFDIEEALVAPEILRRTRHAILAN